MKWFRNLSLAMKLYGLVGVTLVLMTLVSLSSASSGFGSTQTIALLAVAVVLSGSLAFVTVHQLRGAVEGGHRADRGRGEGGEGESRDGAERAVGR